MKLNTRYCHLIWFFLLFYVDIKAQKRDSLMGTFHWEENKNTRFEIADKIFLEANKVKFLSDETVSFLNNACLAKKYYVNTDILVQRICNYGKPSDNVFGFEN